MAEYLVEHRDESVFVCCVRSLPVSRHTGCYDVSTG